MCLLWTGELWINSHFSWLTFHFVFYFLNEYQSCLLLRQWGTMKHKSCNDGIRGTLSPKETFKRMCLTLTVIVHIIAQTVAKRSFNRASFKMMCQKMNSRKMQLSYNTTKIKEAYIIIWIFIVYLFGCPPSYLVLSYRLQCFWRLFKNNCWL